jgi:hypothetical protein
MTAEALKGIPVRNMPNAGRRDAERSFQQQNIAGSKLTYQTGARLKKSVGELFHMSHSVNPFCDVLDSTSRQIGHDLVFRHGLSAFLNE